jgi:hypothetical protein
VRRWTRAIGLLSAIVALALFIDYVMVEAKHARASRAVSRCGGRMGSIHFWPLGAEYDVRFSKPLTTIELNELAELNSLRGSVGVTFIDCELSETQIFETKKKLPNCRLRQVIAGKANNFGPANR